MTARAAGGHALVRAEALVTVVGAALPPPVVPPFWVAQPTRPVRAGCGGWLLGRRAASGPPVGVPVVGGRWSAAWSVGVADHHVVEAGGGVERLQADPAGACMLLLPERDLSAVDEAGDGAAADVDAQRVPGAGAHRHAHAADHGDRAAVDRLQLGAAGVEQREPVDVVAPVERAAMPTKRAGAAEASGLTRA